MHSQLVKRKKLHAYTAAAMSNLRGCRTKSVCLRVLVHMRLHVELIVNVVGASWKIIVVSSFWLLSFASLPLAGWSIGWHVCMLWQAKFFLLFCGLAVSTALERAEEGRLLHRQGNMRRKGDLMCEVVLLLWIWQIQGLKGGGKKRILFTNGKLDYQ